MNIESVIQKCKLLKLKAIGEQLEQTTVATAIADRFVYNSEILILEGSSYRKRIKD